MAYFADINVSQGSVATYRRYGGIFNIHLITNLPRNLPVNFFKSATSLWTHFFGPPCTPMIHYMTQPVRIICLISHGSNNKARTRMVVRGEHLLMYLRRYHLLPLLFRLSVSLPATEVVTLKVRSQHMNETESTCTKSTQLHDAFIGHARRRHQLIGCGETRTVSARPVLNTRTPVLLFILEFANWS